MLSAGSRVTALLLEADLPCIQGFFVGISAFKACNVVSSVTYSHHGNCFPRWIGIMLVAQSLSHLLIQFRVGR